MTKDSLNIITTWAAHIPFSKDVAGCNGSVANDSVAVHAISGCVERCRFGLATWSGIQVQFQ